MATGAAFCVGFVVGDVVVTLHASGAVGSYLGVVNAVAGAAVGMTFASGHTCDAMKARQLIDLVTAIAGGLRRHETAMGLVTSHALSMSLRTLRELLLVAACTRDYTRGLVRGPLVTSFAARMPQIAPS